MTILDTLQQHYPGRERQLKLLYSLLTDDGPPSNLVIWGSQRTGKNSILKSLVEGLDLPYAWITCCQTEAIESVLTSIVDQLKKAGADSQPLPKTLNPVSFVRMLPKLCPLDESRCILILEKPEKLACPSLFELLRKMQDQPRTQLMTIFISNSCCWNSEMQSTSLLTVEFAGYSQEQVLAIMIKEFSITEELSKNFLESVISTLLRFTNDILVLKICIKYLLKKFWQPIEQDQLSKEDVTNLNRHVMQFVSLVLKCLNNGHVSDLEYKLEELDAQDTSRRHSLTKTGLHVSALPVYSKIILIAGFICSYNRPDHDRVLFDTTPGTKRRKSSMMREGKKTGNLGSFDYERLLVVAKSLMQQVDNSENVEPMLSSLFCCQFTSLETFNFIKKVSVDPLRDAKFVCCIDHEFARQLSDSLRLNLPDFLE